MTQWYQSSVGALPEGIEVWDAHTHTGSNDPDGVIGSPDRLLDRLEEAGHRGAVVMTSMDPAGYRTANDRILREADAAGGRLLPFTRIDPRAGAEAIRELERSIDRGFVGLKLHPRGESFSMADPVVATAARMAADAGMPVLVHSGRGIPSLGEDVMALLEANPELNIILAHAAISDLSRLAPSIDDHPGLFFDTAWWSTASLVRLVSDIPPSRILYASDTPYGRPMMSGTLAARVVMTAGYSGAAIAGVFGGNLRTLIEGGRPADLGTAPTASIVPDDPLFLSLYADLHGAIGEVLQGCDPSQGLSLARLSCNVPDDHPYARALAAIAASIDVLDALEVAGDVRARIGRPLITVASAALTPDQPVPEPAALLASASE